jgi:monovalent cation:H+ antiporter, CPA1 family
VGRFVLVHAAAWAISRAGRELPVSWRHVIAWAGLRGSIPIALALGVTIPAGAAGPSQSELLTVVFGVVLLSLLIQGLTVKPLIQRLGLSSHDPHEQGFEHLVGQRVALLAAINRLEDLAHTGQLPPALRTELREQLDRQAEALQQAMTRFLADHPELARTRRDDTVRALLIAERAAIDGAYGRGVISQETVERLHRDIDALLDAPGKVAFVDAAPTGPAGAP